MLTNYRAWADLLQNAELKIRHMRSSLVSLQEGAMESDLNGIALPLDEGDSGIDVTDDLSEELDTKETIIQNNKASTSAIPTTASANGPSEELTTTASADVDPSTELVPTVSQQGGTSVKPSPTLPREVLKVIIQIAMTAVGKTFRMPCLTWGAFRPGINTACLVLDRDLYHVARQTLFNDNTFIFSNFGSDIKLVAESIGLYRCRKEGCLDGGGTPYLNHVDFDLGDTVNPERARLMMESFENSLRYLRSQLIVNHLTIGMYSYCWRSDYDLATFCDVLIRKVKVREKFSIVGFDVHLELNLRALPPLLGMFYQPVSHEITFRSSSYRKLGRFKASYVPVEYLGTEKLPLDRITADFDDPTSAYEKWLKTAPQDCIANGLDFVTDFSNVHGARNFGIPGLISRRQH